VRERQPRTASTPLAVPGSARALFISARLAVAVAKQGTTSARLAVAVAKQGTTSARLAVAVRRFCVHFPGTFPPHGFPAFIIFLY